MAIAAAVVTYGAATGWAAGWGLTTTTTATIGTTVGATSISLTTLSTAGYAVAGAISGAVSGAILTGSLKGALAGAFSGAMFAGIGGHFGDTWNMSRVGANTVAGGLSSKATGGSFADGAKLSFALSVTRLGFEKMKEVTDRLKLNACAIDSNQKCLRLENGEWDTTGTRGENPNLAQGKNSIAGSFFGMEREGTELSGPGPFGSYKIDAYKYFVNDTSKAHDFFNSWHYDYSTGFFSPIQTQLGAELFELYSFTGMPIAGAYTFAGQMAVLPVSGFKNAYND